MITGNTLVDTVIIVALFTLIASYVNDHREEVEKEPVSAVFGSDAREYDTGDVRTLKVGLGVYSFIGKSVRYKGRYLPYCKFDTEFDTYEGFAILKGFTHAVESKLKIRASRYGNDCISYFNSYGKDRRRFFGSLPNTVSTMSLLKWYKMCIQNQPIYIRTDEIYAFSNRLREFENTSSEYDKVFLGKVLSAYEEYEYDTTHYLCISGKDVKVFSTPPVHLSGFYTDKFSFNTEVFRRAKEL